VLLGMGSYLELWDAQTYAAKEAEEMQAPMPDVFKDFSF
jgi:MraZ protein